MKVGVLGTGMVGKTIGTKLVTLGHEVTMGSRTANQREGRRLGEAGAGGARLMERSPTPQLMARSSSTALRVPGQSTQLKAAGAENLGTRFSST